MKYCERVFLKKIGERVGGRYFSECRIPIWRHRLAVVSHLARVTSPAPHSPHAPAFIKESGARGAPSHPGALATQYGGHRPQGTRSGKVSLFRFLRFATLGASSHWRALPGHRTFFSLFIKYFLHVNVLYENFIILKNGCFWKYAGTGTILIGSIPPLQNGMIPTVMSPS